MCSNTLAPRLSVLLQHEQTSKHHQIKSKDDEGENSTDAEKEENKEKEGEENKEKEGEDNKEKEGEDNKEKEGEEEEIEKKYKNKKFMQRGASLGEIRKSIALKELSCLESRERREIALHKSTQKQAEEIHVLKVALHKARVKSIETEDKV
jgi:cobalamin biosynthesis protein CobT